MSATPAAEQTSPATTHLERTFLGSLLARVEFDKDHSVLIVLPQTLRPDDFARDVHGLIFGAMVTMRTRWNLALLAVELERFRPSVRPDWCAVLLGLLGFNTCPTDSELHAMGDEIHALAIARRLEGRGGGGGRR